MWRAKSQAAFSLIEVTLALGIAAISLLAIVGLLATGTQTSHTAVEQSAASDIMATVASDLRATPLTTPRGQAATTIQFALNIPVNPVAAKIATTLYFDDKSQFSNSITATATFKPRYRLDVTFLPNGTGARTATFVDLRMTWPAYASSTAATTSSAETFIALDRN